jgi:uncharacterized membrane protein
MALAVAVAALVALTLAGLVALWPDRASLPAAPERGQKTNGKVVAVAVTPCSQSLPGLEVPPGGGDEFAEADEGLVCSQVSVRLESGPDAGQTAVFVAGEELVEDTGVGAGVVLIRNPDPQVPLDARYQIADAQRSGALLVLGLLFAVCVVALGRLRGLMALVGLAASVTVLVGFLVPALLDGSPPVLTAVVGAAAVMLMVLGLTHGPTVRTATAVLGTSASLLLIMGLSVVFVEAASLTGVTTEEAAYVRATFDGVDVRGLLLAGIVIGALGILDDVTVTQVSTVWELRAAAPTLPSRKLFAAALRVGRDHIASTVNTLLLAYAGASLPLFVVFTTSGEGLAGTLTGGVVAEEVVRTLAGSIGLVAAVPVTTALAVLTLPAQEARRPSQADPGRDLSPQPQASRRGWSG